MSLQLEAYLKKWVQEFEIHRASRIYPERFVSSDRMILPAQRVEHVSPLEDGNVVATRHNALCLRRMVAQSYANRATSRTRAPSTCCYAKTRQQPRLRNTSAHSAAPPPKKKQKTNNVAQLHAKHVAIIDPITPCHREANQSTTQSLCLEGCKRPKRPKGGSQIAKYQHPRHPFPTHLIRGKRLSR